MRASLRGMRRRGRVVEGARLESVYRGDSIVGSNPTVSATHPIISKTCVEIVGLPTFLPTFSRELVTNCFALNKHPPNPLIIPDNPDPTGVAPTYSG